MVLLSSSARPNKSSLLPSRAAPGIPTLYREAKAVPDIFER